MSRLEKARLSRRSLLATGIAGVAVTAGAEVRAQFRREATFVLVHPAWFGGWCWRKLVPMLQAGGYRVYTPTLTGLGERAHLLRRGIDLSMHIEDVVGVLEFEDLHGVVLVANSSGGMVITGVAERVPERIAQLVYVDAFVPTDGESLVDLLPPERRQGLQQFVDAEGEGWLLPRFAPLPPDRVVREIFDVTGDEDVAWILPRLRPTPFRHFTEPVRLADPAAAGLPRVYIRCRGFQMGTHPAFDRHARLAQESPGWRYRELDAPHLPYVTHPQALADILLEVAA